MAIIINAQNDFICQLTEYLKCDENSLAEIKSNTSIHDIEEIQVCRTIIRNLHCEQFYISNIKFEECQFINCHFTDFEFNGIEFQNCKIIEAVFQKVTFMDCTLDNVEFESPFSNTLLFGMTSLENILFRNIEFQFTTFSDCRLQGINFTSGWFHIGKFEPGDFNYSFKSKILFTNISMSSVIFAELDLTQTVFDNSGTGTGFINCILSTQSFVGTKAEGISSIDLFTIKNSDKLPEDVLKNIFGITYNNIKDVILGFTTIQEYHSVFISYSFNDSVIAKEIKELLSKNGVKVFLWESDAPGGKKLKRIMIDEIRDYEKFLFISSQNSLKSEACHFEISEARSKYYRTWNSLFVPIHIDNYLFEVRKEDIPRKFSENYWQNIEELKEFHSLDFKFAKHNNIESSKEFRKLLESFKIN